MQLRPQSFRATADGVEIDAAHGAVRLQLSNGQIEAHYAGHELVNGSAQAYAESQLQAALRAVEAFPFAWSYDAQGQQRITDHALFYAQTFQPELRGIEKLHRWIQQSHARADLA